MRCGAVRCGAVRCGAVRCDAMLCCTFSFVHTRYQPGICTYIHRITKKAHPAQFSSAQRSSAEERSATPCGAAPCGAVPCCAFSFVHAKISLYDIKISLYVYACGVRVVSRGKELLAFASRLFAPKMLDHLPRLSFRSIFPCERA